MDGIMHSTIHKVAKHKAREKWKNHLPRTKYIKQKKRSMIRLGAAGINNRSLVPRVFMVVAMNDVMNFLPPLTFGLVMKSEAMQDIFRESPEKHTAPKKAARQ